MSSKNFRESYRTLVHRSLRKIVVLHSFTSQNTEKSIKTLIQKLNSGAECIDNPRTHEAKMLLEGTSNIVEQVEQIPAQGEKNRRELLHFHTGQVLAIDSDTLAFYRDRGSIDDPLGNGLISYASLPQDQQLSFDSETWVATHASGFVGLYNGFVILILPNEARLYSSNEDALRNTSPVCRLALQ